MCPQPNIASTAFLIADPARAKLLDGGLVTVESEGRHRYYRLSGPHVALVLENLAAIDPVRPVRSRPLGREAQHLRFARCCYDHLAGQVGVAVTQALQRRAFIVPAPDRRFDVTPAGTAWFRHQGLDMDGLRGTRRGLARQCLDWTEREHHLAGPLGVQFMSTLCENGWMRKVSASRAVQVTPAGWAGLKAELGIEGRLGELTQTQ